jgi:hypothetical protein
MVNNIDLILPLEGTMTKIQAENLENSRSQQINVNSSVV